ncbi:MFS transporter [Solihabitans fulvus]|uniref:MFS transporter n=1 Tax=Solihabitans fulvus TaxID=1892852 RepID=A0A5B2XLV8_9PSEU|nr:MFS transporter [Solihabitans fulvus]
MTLAVTAAGLAAFALLYAPQAVLPQLAAEFGLRPGGASLAVSAATGALALTVLPIAALSEVVGRRPVMITAVVVAAVLGLALPFAPSYPVLIALRVAQGAAVAGLPAVAMAYLAEEVGVAGIGAAIGAMVAGNSVGGMSGRLLSGFSVGWLGWRGAVAAVGVFGAACAVLLVICLPRQRSGRRAARRTTSVLGGLRAAVSDPVLLAQYAVGALAMGSFVALYNVIGFRLAAPPLSLSPSVASLVFLAYAVGGVCSALAGRVADRLGRVPVLLGALAVTVAGALVTLPDAVPAVAVGFALFTGGFFAAHSVASGWVGARAPAHARGQASGLYLGAYYLGSSTGGTAGSAAFEAWGWGGLVAVSGGWLAVAALAVLGARTAQKSSGTSIGCPEGASVVSPIVGSVTLPAVSPSLTDRTSTGTSTTTAIGKVPPS